jgi:hypothetical protein
MELDESIWTESSWCNRWILMEGSRANSQLAYASRWNCPGQDAIYRQETLRNQPGTQSHSSLP